MAGVLKSKITTYEFNLGEINQLIAEDLRVPTDKVKVEYVIQEVGGDPLDRFPGYKQVTSVRVTVDESEPKVCDVYDR